MYTLDLDPRLCALEDRLNDPAYQQPVNDKKPLSADDILAFMTSFKTWRNIAKEMNVSNNKLMYWVYKHGIEKPKLKVGAKPNTGSKITKISNEQFMMIYSKHKSTRQMARELKISAKRVDMIIGRLGLEAPIKTKGKKRMPIPRQDFMKAYSPLKTWRQIARELQVPLNRVYSAAKEFKINKPKLRRRSKK